MTPPETMILRTPAHRQATARGLRLGLALLTGTAALALSGCGVPGKGPLPAPRTEAGVAATQSLAPAPGQVAGAWPGEDGQGGGWWDAYGDPQLSALVREGLAGSPDIAAAAARMRKAAGMAQQAGAALLPRADLNAQAAENRISLNQGYPEQFVAFLPHGWNDTAQIAGSIGWDPDIWGKNRAALAAATSERRAAEVDMAAGRLAVAAAIVDAYVDLGGLVAQADVRRAELASRMQNRTIVAGRQQQGLDALPSLRLAESQEATARADLAAADQAVGVRRRQIAALMGEGPDRALTIANPALALLADRPLPADASANLLGRRGDIVAARARLEAAASKVKVARADFFPDIKLSALYGVQSVGIGLLFDKNSIFGNLAAAVSMPLFHGGELKGRYNAARADYDAAVADYDKTVVGAYQQAADAVTARATLGTRVAEARNAAAAADSALDIARGRYRAGLANYLEVLTAEDKAQTAHLALASLEAAFRSADVALVRALGGGFASVPPAQAARAAALPEDRPHE